MAGWRDLPPREVEEWPSDGVLLIIVLDSKVRRLLEVEVGVEVWTIVVIDVLFFLLDGLIAKAVKIGTRALLA